MICPAFRYLKDLCFRICLGKHLLIFGWLGMGFYFCGLNYRDLHYLDSVYWSVFFRLTWYYFRMLYFLHYSVFAYLYFLRMISMQGVILYLCFNTSCWRSFWLSGLFFILLMGKDVVEPGLATLAVEVLTCVTRQYYFKVSISSNKIILDFPYRIIKLPYGKKSAKI